MSVLDDIMKQKSQQIKPNLPANMQGGGGSAANGVPAQTTDPAQTGFTAPKQVTVGDMTKAVTTPATAQPAPAQTPAPAAQPQQLSYVDMLNKMYTPETPEQKAKRERKEKWDKTAAAIGDGISALANLYYTTKGAPNSYDGKNSMSERTRQLYDKLDKDRKENERWYLNHYMNAAKMDEEAKRYADERDYKRGRDAVADERYEDQKKYSRGRDAIADGRYNENIEHRNAREAVQDANTELQHKFQEKQAARQQANADRSYNMQVKNIERQMEKENPSVDMVLGEGKHATIKKSNINAHNLAYVYNKIPATIRQNHNPGKPKYDKRGKIIGYEPPTQDQMLAAIGQFVGQYPEVQEAWKEVGGEITSSSAKKSDDNDNVPPSRRKQNANNNDNVPPSRRK